MAPDVYLGFVFAFVVIAVIPGPTVTLIAANSLTHGTKAGLLNVFGTQISVALMIAAVMGGLGSLVAAMGWWFDWVKLAGALYLVWMGWRLFRSDGLAIGTDRVAPRPRGGFVLQGFLVALSNPKVLLFFGAFIPQFLDPARDFLPQVVIMGTSAMLIGTLSDGSYAVLLGRAGRSVSASRSRLIARIGGLFLMAGGAWLALSRTR